MADTPNDGAWDDLATRGERRGADAVLAAAIASVEAPRDGVPVADMAKAPRSRPKRSRTRRSFGALGIAALVGISGFAVAAINGNNSGGDSPAGVVHQLADAINHEDALAAVATFNPTEVDTLRSTVSNAEHKAAQTKLVNSADAPFAGIDLGVHDLGTRVTKLADHVAKVELTGSVSTKVDGARLSAALQRIADDGKASFDLEKLRAHDSPPFVMTVERDGNWYVSPMYTAFEYVRVANDLPAADFRTPASENGGAETFDDAVTLLFDYVGSGTWDSVVGLLPPDQVPLYAYRAAFKQLMQQQFGSGELFKVGPMDTKLRADGTTVDVNASGTFAGTDPQTGEPATQPWTLVDGCIVGGSSRFSLSGSLIQPEPEENVLPTGTGSTLCLVERGPLPIGSKLPANAPTQIHVVKEHGRWYVSPIGTALDYLDRWVANFDDNALSSLLHDPLLAPVDGTMRLDQRIDAGYSPQSPMLGLAEFRRVKLKIDEATDVVVDTRWNIPNLSSGQSVPGDVYATHIYGPDMKQLTPDASYTRYHLAPGTYDVVTERAPFATLTIWRADHAPDDVPTGMPGCGPTSGGGFECSGSGTAVTVPAAAP